MLFVPPSMPFMDPIPEAEAEHGLESLTATAIVNATSPTGRTIEIAGDNWESGPEQIHFVFYKDKCRHVLVVAHLLWRELCPNPNYGFR